MRFLLHSRALLPPALGLALLTSATAHAGEGTVEIVLITMGPGEHLYTRGGHAALAVVETDAAGKRTSKVYNYGDAHWDDPALAWKFFRGSLEFFLSVSGTLEQTVAKYGMQQNRTVYAQRLNLTPAQARKVKDRLAWEVKPDNRDYPYHHLKAICTTRIRDLLDEITGGELRRQLAGPHPRTIRYYHAVGFTGYHTALLATDIFCGRMHDQPIDKYFATVGPVIMRDYFQQVKVPDPAGGGQRVPLAAPPRILRKREGPPPVTHYGQTTRNVSIAVIALVLVLGGIAITLLPESLIAGVWLLLWALPVGLVGLAITVLIVGSNVPELRANELIAVAWPTDLLLVGLAVRWLRNRAWAGRWARIYALARLGVALLFVVGQLTGVLYQRPLVLSSVGVVCAVALFVVLLRVPRAPGYPPATQQSKSAT